MSEEKPKFVQDLHCSFCDNPRSRVHLLYQSKLGGMPPCICDECIRDCAVDLGLISTAQVDVIPGGKEP